jgi:hypothetical protein
MLKSIRKVPAYREQWSNKLLPHPLYTDDPRSAYKSRRSLARSVPRLTSPSSQLITRKMSLRKSRKIPPKKIVARFYHEPWTDLVLDLSKKYPKINTESDHKTIEKILQDGKNPNALHYGMPLLIIAAKENYTDTLELLLRYGADPNLFSGTTALIAAAENTNYKAMELLLQAGALSSTADKQSITPWYIAYKTHNLPMARLLASFPGAIQPNRRDNWNTIEKWKWDPEAEPELNRILDWAREKLKLVSNNPAGRPWKETLSTCIILSSRYNIKSFVAIVGIVSLCIYEDASAVQLCQRWLEHVKMFKSYAKILLPFREKIEATLLLILIIIRLSVYGSLIAGPLPKCQYRDRFSNFMYKIWQPEMYNYNCVYMSTYVIAVLQECEWIMPDDPLRATFAHLCLTDVHIKLLVARCLEMDYDENDIPEYSAIIEASDPQFPLRNANKMLVHKTMRLCHQLGIRFDDNIWSSHPGDKCEQVDLIVQNEILEQIIRDTGKISPYRIKRIEDKKILKMIEDAFLD